MNGSPAKLLSLHVVFASVLILAFYVSPVAGSPFQIAQAASPNNISSVSTSFYNDCYIYSNNHNDEDIDYSFNTIFPSPQRTAIELPENFNPQDLQYLYFSTNQTYTLIEINSMFYLSENYIPIYIGGNIGTQIIRLMRIILYL